MEKKIFDLIIIGSGPAGLSAAVYACRSGLKTLILGNAAASQTFRIDLLENYPGVFPAQKGYAFIDSMKNQAEKFGAVTDMNQVVSVEVPAVQGGMFVVNTDKISYTAVSVMLCTGAVHKKLGVEGEDTLYGKGVSYCATCDGPFFKGKKVAVVGGGDSACSEALFLSSICSEVILIHRRNEFRAQKSLVEQVEKNPVVKIMLNFVVQSINGRDKVESVTVGGENIAVDGVFVSVGTVPAQTFVPELKKDDVGYVVTGEDMQTSVSGLFAAGDIRSKSMRQVVTACSDGAVAAGEALLYVKNLKNEVHK